MKSNFKLILLASTLLGATLVAAPTVNNIANDGLLETTSDVLNNEVGSKLVRDIVIGENGEVATSNVFVQYGLTDYEGSSVYVMRFATAVKGDINSISYTRDSVAGLEDKGAQVVNTVYKGINANGSTYYYHPDASDNGLTTDVSYAGNYYWACYSIRFVSGSTYQNTDFTVSLTVNDNVVATKTANLQALLDANKKEYSLAGQVLEDTYIGSNNATAKKSDYSTKDALALNSKYYRVFYKIDVSDILDNTDFDQNTEENKFVLDISCTEGADALNKWSYNLYGADVKYGEEYTAGIPFNNVTWNTVQTDSSKEYLSLNSSTLNKIFEKDTIKVSKNLSNENGRLQIKLTYDQIKDYVCLDAGEHYGKAVFMFSASAIDTNDAPTVKVGSLEHSTLAPTLSYVYKK